MLKDKRQTRKKMLEISDETIRIRGILKFTLNIFLSNFFSVPTPKMLAQVPGYGSLYVGSTGYGAGASVLPFCAGFVWVLGISIEASSSLFL
jgi:hypothetical protein